MVSLAGQQLSTEEKEILTLPVIGGVILFAENYENKEQLADLTRTIKAIKPDCIIGIDHEGGRVQRLRKGFTEIPPMAAFGKFYETDPVHALRLVYMAGDLIAEELRAVHIDLGFCPVLDLDTGMSSVIGDRAFHSSADIVAELAESFIQGLHNGGIISVGKHYPGHGSVAEDTHSHQVLDSRRLEQIKQHDMRPYQYLIERDLLDAVMSAHIVYDTVDDKPATVSTKWLKNILCGELCFEGLIFSDDLAMRGMKKTLQTTVMTDILEACHILLICRDQALIRRAIDELSDLRVQEYLTIHCREVARHWQNRIRLLAKRKHIPIDHAVSRKELYELNENFQH